MVAVSAKLTNWAGNITFSALRTHQPTSLDELRRLVAGSPQIRAVGSGHSFSAVADTPGDLVALHRLPRTVQIDRLAATATVSGAITYAELVGQLNQAGFALANLASLPHITVAGTVATGTHGSGSAQRCLSAAVSALRLVGPDGDVVDLRRDADGERFGGCVVSLGALGIVTDVTLDLEPAYQMTQRVRVGVPLADVARRPYEVLDAAYSVSVFTDWRADDALVFLKHRTDQPAVTWDGGRDAAEMTHPVRGMPTDSCTAQLGVPGWWHERLPHFRPDSVPGVGDQLQSEYYLPRAAAPDAFAALLELGETMAPVLHVSEVRTVRGDDLWLSPAYGRDSVTFHFTWRRAWSDVLPVMTAVEQALAPLGARPHWGKLTAIGPAQIVRHYGRAADFANVIREHDPDRVFGNALIDQLFGG